jgi:hypothetical protein
MKKIPLEATIVGAYRFLFTKIISIVGTIWFPTVLVLGLLAGLFYLIAPHGWLTCDFSHFDPKILLSAPFIAARAVMFVAGLLAGSMILVGLMRKALGLKKSVTLIYFSLGAPVWRMIAAFFLGIVIFVAAGVVIGVLIALGAKFAAPMIPHGYAIASCIVLGTVLALFAIYASFRLFFFLPAVVVAENRIGLGRSWSLGGGNFWRMFVVYLLAVVPAGFILGIVLNLTVMPLVIAEALKLPHHPEAKDAIAFLHGLMPLLPVVVAISIVYGIAVRGLMVGAIASAYNAVTAAPKEEAPAAAVPMAAEPEPVVPPEVAPVIPDGPTQEQDSA